ncbi:LysM domain-containing protein [Opitutaceae bacterium TAV4]|uniref:LysM peptidoglycan-binding domain-containing protein n=1 Tax=Geminisphaera colitermitum TaxID=1148786 RepID=UPI000158C75F|nr:LysM domain-containing protein [Geminisphaera colitermitum]RRJ96901.1 LysM domain-containing protein [Opitutaceae bacterium TAV4]RRK00841.1 LysM domain-containing protein [Opitutaceae bacterium TAV3]
MDTISRESNGPSYLPVAAVIVGVIALVLGGVALAKVSSINKQLVAQDDKLARVSEAENQAAAAVAAVEQANRKIDTVARDTGKAFGDVANVITEVRGELAKVQELASRRGSAPAAAAAANASGAAAATPRAPAVAGPDEYIVKSGDTGVKIARGNNVSLSDLQAVNPDVNWNKLHVGQKVKLPAKR